MKWPQKIIIVISSIIAGLVFAGAIYDAIGNSIQLITPPITYIGTGIIIVSWAFVEIYLKKHPYDWVDWSTGKITYSQVPPGIRWAIFGVILSLWIPMTVNLNTNQSKAKLNANENKIILLVANIGGIEPGKYGVTDIIYKQLEDTASNSTKIVIKRLGYSLNTSSEAKTIGKEQNATFVLWGNYLTNEKLSRFTVNFETIKESSTIKYNQDLILKDDTQNLLNYTLQEKLSDTYTSLLLTIEGVLFWMEDKNDQAIERFSQALLKSSDEEGLNNKAIIYSSRALAYLDKYDYKNAIKDLDEAIKLDPNVRFYELRAMSFFLDSQFDKAIEDCEKIIRSENLSSDIYHLRGLAYAQKSLLGPALADFNKAIELDKTNIVAYVNRAGVFSDTGQKDQAIADLDIVIATEKEDANVLATAFNNRGSIRAGKGLIELAKDDFSNGIEIVYATDQPIEAAFLLFRNRAALLVKLHQLDLALVDLNVGLQINPNDAESYHDRAEINFRLNKFELAISDLNRAIGIDPTKSMYFNNRAMCYSKLGKQDLAISDFGQAIKLEQKGLFYTNRCISILAKEESTETTKRVKEILKLALSDCSKAIELSPEDSLFYVNRSNIFRFAKEYDKALIDLQKVLSLDEKNFAANLGLGLTYRDLGDKQNAQIYFDKALNTASTKDEIELVKKTVNKAEN